MSTARQKSGQRPCLQQDRNQISDHVYSKTGIRSATMSTARQESGQRPCLQQDRNQVSNHYLQTGLFNNWLSNWSIQSHCKDDITIIYHIAGNFRGTKFSWMAPKMKIPGCWPESRDRTARTPSSRIKFLRMLGKS